MKSCIPIKFESSSFFFFFEFIEITLGQKYLLVGAGGDDQAFDLSSCRWLLRSRFRV